MADSPPALISGLDNAAHQGLHQLVSPEMRMQLRTEHVPAHMNKTIAEQCNSKSQDVQSLTWMLAAYSALTCARVR